jgi:glycosyltransferase involved in cell wall biosynthesis
MKKIAFFTPSLNIGGVERVFITYANFLVENNYIVDYVLCHENGDIKNFLDKKIKCTILNTKLRYSVFKLSKYIAKNNPDYLITGGEISNTIAILSNKILLNKTKVIISQHNYFNIEQSGVLSNFVYKFLYKNVYKYAYKVIAVSNGIANFIEGFNVEKSKIVTIYNPVNISLIENLSGKSDEAFSFSNYILFVGRLSEVKNLNFLIRSFFLLRRNKPEFSLVIAGDGPLKESLKSLVSSLALNNSVFFVGIVPNPFFLIKNALLVVLPSFSEALPTIILESFALGKTILATPTNGAVDILRSGEYGYLSHSFDDELEFSDLMFTASNSNIDSKALINYARSFDIVLKAKELENILI